MKTHQYELRVLVHGKPVREYEHEGRLYIEGRKGSEYTIQVRNRTHQRILAVLSVDGLSIITGEEASTQGPGYILSPRSSINIPGWSLNDDEVAKFVFGKPAHSYAAKAGKDKRNVGCIGCAIFTEKPVHIPAFSLTYTGNTGGTPPATPWPRGGGTADPNPQIFWNTCGSESTYSAQTSVKGAIPDAAVFSCSVQPQNEGVVVPDSAKVRGRVETQSEIGTKFGKRMDFTVTTIDFNRSDTPVQVFDVTYDTREGLARRGVDIRKRPTVGRPSPFPKDHCRPPAGWDG